MTGRESSSGTVNLLSVGVASAGVAAMAAMTGLAWLAIR
jgi:hypothetical protein